MVGQEINRGGKTKNSGGNAPRWRLACGVVRCSVNLVAFVCSAVQHADAFFVIRAISSANACAASISAILSAIAQAQFK